MSPLLPVVIVVLASVLSTLLSRKPVPLLRCALATILAAAIEYASVFAISGFGWGWADPSISSLSLGRFAVGLSVTASCIAFSWLTSSVRPGVLVTLILLLPTVIMLPEYSYDGPWAMLVVLLVITYAMLTHLRASMIPLSNRDTLPGAQ